MKKQITFFQNQLNLLAKRNKGILPFALLLFFTTASFSQVTIDCAGGPVNTTYCYVDNDTTQFVFTNTDGFPLNVFFNAGQVENGFDELIVLDTDGVTDLNIGTPYGNSGDLTGISYQSSGDTITIMISSDNVVSCSSNAFTPWDFDVWCQSCLNPTVTYAVYGDCDTAYEFFIDVNLDDLGSSTSYLIEDDQGNSQAANATGVYTFGPYVPFIDVIITTSSQDDPNCIVSSGGLTYTCISTGNCDLINAGPDVTLACDDNCTDLEATAIEMPYRGTTSYLIEGPICDLPPLSGGDPTGLIIDDVWSTIINIDFNFSYFGVDYNQLVVGANGQISFDTSLAGQYNDWQIDPAQLLPITDVNFPLNTIYGAFHDINPNVNSDPDAINYFVTGTAPYRIFVINFNMVPQFSCTSLITTQQILLYESLNVIAVNLINKPVCTDWNDGLATLGLMGNNLTEFSVPPDRNTGVWEAINENWRFVPNGDLSSDSVFEWLDEDGNVLGTDFLINVCPTETTTYTASLTINLPGGGTDTITDDVLVEFAGLDLTIELGEDQGFCDQADFEIIPVITGDATGATYLWSPNGETTPTITVTESGTYTLEISILDCSTEDSVLIEFFESPIIDLGNDIETCFEEIVILDASPSNMDPESVIYLWSTGETTPAIIVTEGGTYTVTVTAPGDCITEDSITISGRTDLEVFIGDDFKSCPGETIVLTATTSEEGVTYQWFYDGMMIQEGATLELLDISSESFGTYEVVITKGDCTGTNEIELTTYDVGNCVISQGISPGGTPGFNDSLDLEFLVDRVGISKLQIFNRYGTVVYERNNYVNEWEGQTTDGDELPTGTYFYVLDLLGVDDVYGSQPTGWIYLNRDAN